MKKLKCEVRAIEEIISSISGCTNQAVEYGFLNPVSQKTVILGEACYNEELGQTLFVHTKIKANYKNYDLDKVALRVSDDATYLKKRHPLSRFKLDFLAAARIDTLNERLTESLGNKNIPELIQTHFIDRNLLLNYQFYNVKKLGWNYVMVNGNEVVDTLNGLFEDLKNKLKYDQATDIYFGTHGVLNLVNSKSAKKVDLYMSEENRFPIAKYFWVVAKNGDKIVAFIVPNQGHSGSGDGNLHKDGEFCSSKCNQIKWFENEKSVAAISSGHILCCDYVEFKKKISEMPSLDGTFSLLL